MSEQKNKARENAGQKIQSNPDDTATDDERRLVAAMLNRPARYFLEATRRTPFERHYQLCDLYYETAERRRKYRGNDEVTQAIYDFSWWLNDLATDERERQRTRVDWKCPPYGAEIARQRARGRVPMPASGYHVSIALQPQYRRAAPLPDACLVVGVNQDAFEYDYRFLAGLDVLILCCRSEIEFADWLAMPLAIDGLRSVSVRLLNEPERADEKLFPTRRLSWEN